MLFFVEIENTKYRREKKNEEIEVKNAETSNWGETLVQGLGHHS